jgi:Fic family protein
MVQSGSNRAGDFIVQQAGPDGFAAFVPKPLPPKPSLELGIALHARLDRANQTLGRLDGITLLLPDPDLFLYSYVRKEAVLSSQIEGTQSSLSDLLLFEHDAVSGVPRGDVEEASRYVAAMYRGIELLGSGLPVSVRMLREVHAVLMHDARGGERQPGEFRRVQNWIGGARPATARFVPPPAHYIPDAMADLERFLNDVPSPTPVLIKAALAHAQFETIHPFLDGNGRLGRLLVTLLLVADGVLRQPLLYLSLYLKRHRDLYYDHLQRVRTDGDWEAWLRFFVDGVIDVAASTAETTTNLVQMIERDRQRVQQLGRRPPSRRCFRAGTERAARVSGVRPSRSSRHPPGNHGPAARQTLRLRRIPLVAERGRSVSVVRLRRRPERLTH